jgi:hypothetical protein
MRTVGGAASTDSHLHKSRPLWTTLPGPLSLPTRIPQGPLPRYNRPERKHAQARQQRLQAPSCSSAAKYQLSSQQVPGDY